MTTRPTKKGLKTANIRPEILTSTQMPLHMLVKPDQVDGKNCRSRKNKVEIKNKANRDQWGNKLMKGPID